MQLLAQKTSKGGIVWRSTRFSLCFVGIVAAIAPSQAQTPATAANEPAFASVQDLYRACTSAKSIDRLICQTFLFGTTRGAEAFSKFQNPERTLLCYETISGAQLSAVFVSFVIRNHVLVDNGAEDPGPVAVAAAIDAFPCSNKN